VIAKLEDNYNEQLQKRADAQADFEFAKKQADSYGQSPAAELAAEAAKRLEQNKDKVTLAQTAFESAKADLNAPVSTTGVFGDTAAYTKTVQAGREKAFLDATTALASAKLNQEADTDAVAAHEAETKRLNDKTKEAADAVSHYIKGYKDAADALNKEKSDTAQRQNERDSLELQGAGRKPGSVLDRTLLRDIEVQEERTRNIGDGGAGRLNAEQATGTRQLIDALRTAGANQNQINALLREMADLHISHAQKLKDLETALHQVRQQMKTTVNP
jgi:hypothetical protein